MPEPITRRRFLRDSAIVSGAVLIAEPSWLVSEVGAATVGERFDRRVARPAGIDAVVIDHEDGSPVRWTRLGADVTMELGATSILIGVPTVMHELDEVLTLDELQRGIGHHEIVRDLGEPALMRLRDEISYRTVLQPSADDQT